MVYRGGMVKLLWVLDPKPTKIQEKLLKMILPKHYMMLLASTSLSVAAVM